jgi:hypothetical protein
MICRSGGGRGYLLGEAGGPEAENCTLLEMGTSPSISIDGKRLLDLPNSDPDPTVLAEAATVFLAGSHCSRGEEMNHNKRTSQKNNYN